MSRLAARLPIVLFGSVPLIVVVALLGTIGFQAVGSSDNLAQVSLGNFREVFSDPFIWQATLNTFVFSTVAIITSLCISTPLAWIAERTDLKGRGVILPTMTLGLLVPGFATAMGWLVLLHDRIGILTRAMSNALQIDSFPVSVNNVVGMGVVQGFSLSGLMFIMIASSFRAMDPALEESAEAHGLNLRTRLRKITFPLMWPSILAASLYTFTVAFGAFDIPAVIGMGSDIFVFSTLLYEQVRPEGGIPRHDLAAATSFLVFSLALLLSAWYLHVIKQASRYSVVTGKGYRPKLYQMSGIQTAVSWTFIVASVFLIGGLPFIALVWASLNKYFVFPTVAALSGLNLDAYRALDASFIGPAVRNTILLVLVAPTITVCFCLAISWVVVRSKIRGVSEAFDVLAFLPHALPNIILAVGALIIGLYWVPHWIPFYGTLNILLTVYVVSWLGLGTRVYNSAFLQIHKDIDEAGSAFGLSKMMVLRKILLPLIIPAILYTWIWIALLAYRELTVAAFLASKDNVVLSTFIWQQWQQESSRGAALTVVMILGMTPLILVYFWAGNKMAAPK